MRTFERYIVHGGWSFVVNQSIDQLQNPVVEKMERRGPYRRYNVDPSTPIPKTTLWRMKKSGLEPTVNRTGLHDDSDVDLSGKFNV